MIVSSVISTLVLSPFSEVFCFLVFFYYCICQFYNFIYLNFLLQYCFCLCFRVLATRHMGSQLPEQGLNPHPLHWKAKSFLNLIIYLFLAVLSLCCCGGSSLVAASGSHSLAELCSLLIEVASVGAEHEEFYNFNWVLFYSFHFFMDIFYFSSVSREFSIAH